MQNIDLNAFKNEKCALVLSGGVIKAAAWHLGVALALDDMGFTLKSNSSVKNPELEIGTYVGSSAGSLINLYFAAGYRPIDVIDSTLNRNSKKLKTLSYKDILSLREKSTRPPRPGFYNPFENFPFLVRKILEPTLKMSGLFTTKGLYDYIHKNITGDNPFEAYDADMFVVATQLDHSRKVIFSKYNYPNPNHDSTSAYYTGIDVADAVAASMSVPPFYSPFPIKNPHTEQTDYFIDGEIRETLSTHVARDHNCKYVISSWTHTPYHYHDEIGSLVNYGLPAICVQSIYLMIQKKIVASRAKIQSSRDIISTVDDYMRTHKFPAIHRKKINSILERKLAYDKNKVYIDIYPKHDNYNVFFSNAFSLNPKVTAATVKSGYNRTVEVFESQEWLNKD